MKINRFKKSQKILSFFTTNFQYHEPYQVLIDATFCQAALQNKVIIEEQLKKYFQSELKLLTTQCVILEAESLGGPLTGATMIVKRFYVHKCGHEGKPISASECIKSMTKSSRYIVATQDRTLQQKLRKVPGRALLYLHKATPVLEGPSDASKKYVNKHKNDLPENIEKRIDNLKKTAGIPSADDDTSKVKKKKGPKNPNPLSCKKKKPRANAETKESLNKVTPTINKPKRKRIKIASHVKEVLKKNIKS
ncbi:rRNA-processing protein UTP23 homolog [Episyrphus balteatus]|uniref:rRNA-processing protein UTP23 homolog n=1 Tax=Episyrphus balteatus TaxID=286459 RepID=UPI002485AED6|nr:rRNA-processing protein UTP23 homolog [Episyrphus balteatus]